MLRRWVVFSLALILGAVFTLAQISPQSQADAKAKDKKIAEGNAMGKKELTKQEKHIILEKGTEPPFSGTYWNHFEKGVYNCKRCGARLFESEMKFSSDCGWPSFDDAIDGAVKEQPDADGRRTEIVCAKCGAHLGHVFRGEAFTPKNTRHCVNSLSMTFAAEDEGERAAYFAGGCFWGVEHLFEKMEGVIEAVSGYMGGEKEAPSYEEVCSGKTGHAETVKVVYDPSKTSYEALAKRFFEIHDPTQKNSQGPDIGHQYRSAVFVENDKEKAIVQSLIDKLKKRGFDVQTEIAQAEQFWPAEGYHQDYYEKTGKTPYCHAPVDRFGDE